MLVRVKAEELEQLRELQIKTYGETFGASIPDEDLKTYFEQELSLETITKEWANPESEVYFMIYEGEKVGFLKLNWGRAQTEETGLDNAFEIQRIYLLRPYQKLGLGKKMFDFALTEAKSRGFSWVWLGVWERNFKAQDFYFSFSFEKFSQHEYATGDTVDIDWLLRKRLDD